VRDAEGIALLDPVFGSALVGHEFGDDLEGIQVIGTVAELEECGLHAEVPATFDEREGEAGGKDLACTLSALSRGEEHSFGIGDAGADVGKFWNLSRDGVGGDTFEKRGLGRDCLLPGGNVDFKSDIVPGHIGQSARLDIRDAIFDKMQFQIRQALKQRAGRLGVRLSRECWKFFSR